MVTEFAMYLTSGLIIAGIFMVLGFLYDRNLGVLEIIVGFGIWTAIITFFAWVVHMVYIGMNAS